jgi:FAD:protein FMN transferase
MIAHHCLGMLGVLAALALLPVNGPVELQRWTFTEVHMGTRFQIVLYAADEATAKRAARAAFDRAAELDNIMSDYKPASELMQLCKKAGGEPVPVSADLFDVLTKALDLARKSKGAFDPTVGPVVRLWRRARRTRELPDAAALKRAIALVSWEKVRLDPKTRTVQLLLEGMLLDLGGIGKGYAAEAMLAVLRRHGITRALVAASGDIAVGDAPPGAAGWKVGIAPLKNPGADPQRFLLLKNAAVSTSGDGEQGVEIGGKRYSHHVDPQTGMALIGRRSATVVTPSGTLSDGLGTAVCVMGLARGQALIERIDGAALLWLAEGTDGRVEEMASSRFSRYEWPKD